MTSRIGWLAIGLTVIVGGGGPRAVGDPPAPEGAPNGQGEAPQPGQADQPEDMFAEERDLGEVLPKTLAMGRSWLEHRQDGGGSWAPLSSGKKLSLEYSQTASGPLRVRPSPSGTERKTGAPYAFDPGVNALVLYTLLRTGSAPSSPVIRRGFQRIRDMKLELPASSPASAMLLLAVCSTAAEMQVGGPSGPRRVVFASEFRTWCQQLVDHLLAKQDGLGWRYNAYDLEQQPGGLDDLASTTLVAFALLAAHGRGIKVDPQVWENLLKFTLQQQDENGPEVPRPVPAGAQGNHAPPLDHARGFAYMRSLRGAPEERSTVGMTCCGIANLVMARYVLTETPARKKRWEAARLDRLSETAIYDGLAWLGLHWQVASKEYHHHTHWMVEMCMGMVGRRVIGTHLWWEEIARDIVDRQGKTGDWESGTNPFDRSVLDTCFALLVLSRSTKSHLAALGLGSLALDAR